MKDDRGRTERDEGRGTRKEKEERRVENGGRRIEKEGKDCHSEILVIQIEESSVLNSLGYNYTQLKETRRKECMKAHIENIQRRVAAQVEFAEKQLHARDRITAHANIEQTYLNAYRSIPGLLERFQDNAYAEFRGALIAGLLGLARIYHTSLNGMLKIYADGAWADYQSTLAKIEGIRKDVYFKYLPLAQSTTIDGTTYIDWIGETDQDQLATDSMTQEKGIAIEIAKEMILATEARYFEHRNAKNPLGAAASESALGVLYRRKAQLTGNQRDWKIAMQKVLNAHTVIPNIGRVRAVAKPMLHAAFLDLRGGPDLVDRWNNFNTVAPIVAEEMRERFLPKRSKDQ